MTSHKKHFSYRSVFWPIILISVGLVWLLSNLGIIPRENLWLMINLWPVLLVLAGLDMIFARRTPIIGVLLGLGVIALVVYLLLGGQNLGIEAMPEVKQETFEVSAEGVTAADIELNLSTQPVKVFALAEPDKLIEARIGHFGTLDFSAKGNEIKRVSLRQTAFPDWFSLALPIPEEELDWEIALNPDIPTALEVECSTGSAGLDLEGLSLTDLKLDMSTGNVHLSLPASSDAYTVYIDGSTGTLNLRLAADTGLSLRIDGSSGNMEIILPEGAAVQVRVNDSGAGSVSLPDGFTHVSGFAGHDAGVWETAAYQNAAYQINITISDLGSGDIDFSWE